MRIVLGILILVFFWLALDTALVHGAELELSTAGQIQAPTEPFYQGAN